MKKRLNAQEFSDQISRKDVEAIRVAQSFFRDIGLPIESNGLVKNELTEEQIAKLKAWNESTTVGTGIIMPSEQDFYSKTLLAISLWRQKKGAETTPGQTLDTASAASSGILGVNYLLGKGVGVEVALRGQLPGRTKRPIKFPYRSHSDFELYGVDYEAGENGENLGGKPIYTKEFLKVFGAQEYFPLTKTKGLKEIPPSLLHATAEVLDFGGIPVHIPQLELLFLDKYISRESTPRTEGYDAELLARQYVLDRAKIHQYLDQFVIEPAVTKIQAVTQNDYGEHLTGIKNNIIRLKAAFHAADIDPQPEDLAAELNDEIGKLLSWSTPDSNIVSNGIFLSLWADLKPEDIDLEGNIIDQAFLKNLRNKLSQIEKLATDRLKKIHQEIDQLFDRIEKEFTIKE